MAIGDISARFESRGKPSQTPPATGEQSYGTFQLLGDTRKSGKDPSVITFLKSSGYYKSHFSGLERNGDEFKAKWKELGKTDPLFGVAQYRYISETHFYPLARHAEKRGVPRTAAINEALFSMGVQHGGAKKILDAACSKLKDVQKSTEEDIVTALYDARIDYVNKLIRSKKGREEDLRGLIEKRYPAEKAAVLGLLKNKTSTSDPVEDAFESLGLDAKEAKTAAAAARAKDEFNGDELLKRLKELQEWHKKNQIPSVAAPEEESEDDDEDEEEGEEPPVLPAIPPLAPLPDPSGRQADFDGMNKFLDFLGALESKPLQQTAGLIQNILKGYEAINKLSTLTGATLTLAALGPIGALGGVILGIINLFSKSGPSDTQIILDQLQHLSEQLNGIKEYISDIAKELFKGQQEILNAVYQGFSALHLELDNQFSSMRLDFGERLDKISAGIRYTCQRLSLEIKELALQDLRMRYNDTRTWLDAEKGSAIAGNPADKIPTLIQALFNWSVSESAEALYTGRMVSPNTTPPEFLKDILYAERFDPELKEDVLAGNLIGYLANYYKTQSNEVLSADIDVKKIPNPQMWYDISQKFLALKQAFLEYDDDRKNIQVTRVIEAGAAFNSFVNALGQDQRFWSLMCVQYINLTLKLRTAQIKFIEAYSKTFKEDFNHKPAAYQKDPVTDWNFLTTPDRLVAIMGLRKIREINFQNALGATNTKPFLSVWFPWIPQTFVAAEYLGEAHFSATQIGNFSPSKDDVYPVNPIRPPEFEEVDGKLNARGGKRQDKAKVIGKAGVEVLRKVGSGERVEEWTLPTQLFINSDRGQYTVGQVNFVGSYAQLAVETNFWLEAEVVGYRPGSRGSDIPIFKPKYSMSAEGPGNYGYDVPANFSTYVKTTWDGGEQFKFNAQSLVSRDQEAGMKSLIEKYFVSRRKEVAGILRTGVDCGKTDGTRTTELLAYRDTLIALDVHVRLMQLFAYLMGKDATLYFDSFYCSGTVERNLTIFEKNANIDTPFLHAIRQISAAEIFSLPELSGDRNRTHPRKLFEQVCLGVEKYKKSKEFFPEANKPGNKPVPLFFNMLSEISSQGGLRFGEESFYESAEKIAAERENVEAFCRNEEDTAILKITSKLSKELRGTDTSRMLADEGTPGPELEIEDVFLKRDQRERAGIKAMVGLAKANLAHLSRKEDGEKNEKGKEERFSIK